mgnify:CR=1 FL=1
MYIISKQKDYYDGVVGSVGMDKTIVYERKTVEIEDNKSIPKFVRSTRFHWKDENPFLNLCRASVKTDNDKGYYAMNGFIVGFCGKLYLGWKFYYKVKAFLPESGEYGEVTKEDIIYDYENVKQYLKPRYWGSSLDDNAKFVNSYNPIEIFRECDAPIFLYDSYNERPRNTDVFYINPVLKDWEFYKVVDAFTAFTQLQMFIGGVLGTGEKKITEISNENKIEQHGFDRKWSFRREPTKKTR